MSSAGRPREEAATEREQLAGGSMRRDFGSQAGLAESDWTGGGPAASGESVLWSHLQKDLLIQNQKIIQQVFLDFQ